MTRDHFFSTYIKTIQIARVTKQGDWNIVTGNVSTFFKINILSSDRIFFLLLLHILFHLLRNV